MRITGGIHRGRILKSPEGRDIRPTSDKIRQAIFNMLESRGGVANHTVIDAFCGTGALGLEALSRGAESVLFCDKNAKSLLLAKANTEALGEKDRCDFLKTDSTKIKLNDTIAWRATLVFCDPPYDKNMISNCLEGLHSQNWLSDDVIYVLETEKTFDYDSDKYEIDWHTEKIYKDTKIIMFKGRLK